MVNPDFFFFLVNFGQFLDKYNENRDARDRALIPGLSGQIPDGWQPCSLPAPSLLLALTASADCLWLTDPWPALTAAYIVLSATFCSTRD